MYAVEVSLFQKRSHQYSFTYFAKDNFDPGTLLLVPFQKREVIAIVIQCQPLQAIRQNLRRSNFSTRKVIDKNGWQIEPAMAQAMISTSKKYLVQPGSLANLLLPKNYNFENHESVETKQAIALIDLPKVRLAAHKRLLEKEINEGRSVVICLPTANFIFKYAKDFSNLGNVVPIHHQLSKKELVANLEKIRSEAPAIFVITPYFLWLRPVRCQTLIIEHALHKYWYPPVYPFINFKDLAVLLGENRGWNTITASTLMPEKPASHINKIGQSIDKIKKEPQDLLAPETVRKISILDRAFIYSNRTGLATVVTCQDCGAIMQDKEGRSYKLIEENNQRWFSVGRSKTAVFDTCPHCAGNRLNLNGHTTRRLEEFLRENFPDREIITINKTTASTLSKLEKIMSDGESGRKLIVIGGELSIPFLRHKSFDLAVIPSAHQLGHITQTYFIEEVADLVATIENSAKTIILEYIVELPRHISWISHDDFEAAYALTNTMRKTLRQPPFSHQIYVTAPTQIQTNRLSKLLSAELGQEIGQNERTLIITISELDKQDQLINILINLSNSFIIKVNPPSLT